MQALTIPELQCIPFVPERGTIYLSVHLTQVNPGELWHLAQQIGLKPQLAYLPTRYGIQIHALLHHEQRPADSLLGDELDNWIDALIEGGIDSQAIRFVYGGGRAVA